MKFKISALLLSLLAVTSSANAASTLEYCVRVSAMSQTLIDHKMIGESREHIEYVLRDSLDDQLIPKLIKLVFSAPKEKMIDIPWDVFKACYNK